MWVHATMCRVPWTSYLSTRLAIHQWEDTSHQEYTSPYKCVLAEIILGTHQLLFPNLSSTHAPLYKLLHKNTTWRWGAGISEGKRLIDIRIPLVHCDPTKELVLACDASLYGVGAMLSHRMEDRQDKPITFASRPLLLRRRSSYSQLDKEALAIIFSVKRFNQYRLGWHFTILSDHKSLQHLFNEECHTYSGISKNPEMGSYTGSNYHVEYKAGSDHSNACRHAKSFTSP